MYATVTLLSNPYSSLTYLTSSAFPDNFWKCGLRVAVPLGGKNRFTLRSGFICSLESTAHLPPGVSCKEIFWPLENRPVLNEELLGLSASLAARQGLAPGCVYGHVLPQGLRLVNKKIKFDPNLNRRDMALTELGALSLAEREEIAALFSKGQAYILPSGEDPATSELCYLQVDPPWPVRPGATTQTAILNLLHGKGVLSRREIIRQLGAPAARSLHSLVASRYVGIRREEDDDCKEDLLPPPAQPFELNGEQREAIINLASGLEKPSPECRLLYGVTGSGKTAVYLEIIRTAILAGKSVFILAPEVALAHKLRRDVRMAYPDYPLFFYHGYQSSSARDKIFRALSTSRTPSIIVGTRSALFLPAFNTGCIILDEEHDGSFKQDESFAYHAKEVAWYRINRSNGLLVLGSATPDIKTWQACETGRLETVRMSHRVTGKPLPPVRLVDIGERAGLAAAGSISANGQSILAPESEDELRSCMARGEQAVIFLNRRGYSPMIFCVDCSRTLRCPHCEIGLSFHKDLQQLTCHYCGYSTPYPTPCPDCGHMNFLAIGEGTERLEERLELIARQPVLRLDRDNVRRPGKMEEILESFAAGQSPFLVGTQMLSKGHHFPNVTLVIVADGDIGLNLPDYRAAEKTFQLLVQAAGRAGRGEKPGQVLIQTRNRMHYCWEYVRNYDYEGFYKAELARRKKHNYPPFTHLGLLRITFPSNSPTGHNALAALAAALREKRKPDLTILGPAPAPIARLRGNRRFHCLIKSSQWNLIRDIYFFAQAHESSRHLKFFLDLDPVNML